jgi:hypothetical protein
MKFKNKKFRYDTPAYTGPLNTACGLLNDNLIYTLSKLKPL